MASSATSPRVSVPTALLAAPSEPTQASGIVATPSQSKSDDDVQLDMRRPNLRRVSTMYQSRATPN